LYQKLIDALHEKQGVTLSEEEEEILELCKLPLALFTMSEGLKLLNTELLPDRVANNYYATTTEGNSQKNPSGNERFAAAAALETRARSEMRRLQIAVAKYYATINGTTPEPIKLSNTNYHRKIVSF
jgi:hypothetical protein